MRPQVELVFDVTLESYTTTTTVTEGNLIEVTADSVIGLSTANATMTDPSGITAASSQVTLPATATAVMSLPAGGSSLLNLSQAIRNGLSIELTNTGEGSSSETITTQNDAVLSTQTTSNGAQDAMFALGERGLVISGTASDFAMTMMEPTIFPLELSFGVSDLGLDVMVPVNASDDVQPFKVAFALEGISIDDQLWGLVDPAGALPRDPAVIALDVSGTSMLGFDLLDFEAMSQMQGPPPVTIDDVSLNRLELSAIGGMVTGQGAFTLDWTDFSTIPGMPKPVGSLEVNALGINAVMGSLVSMGLIAPEDTMGAMMMLGLFAEPVGDDAYRTVLEINEQGHIIANGQRLQ